MAKLSVATSTALLLHVFHILSTLHFYQTVDAEMDICDEETYYKPYVRLYKKRNMAPIAQLKSSGFMDLRFRTKLMMCIHGTVVLYSDVEKLAPESKLRGREDQSHDTLSAIPDARYPSPEHKLPDANEFEEELLFRKPELASYNHFCFAINRVPHKVYKKMQVDQGRAKPELMFDTPTMGKLVLGVFLVSSKEGTNHPELAWFKGPRLEYLQTSDKTVKDSSFVLSGPVNASHCIKLPDGTILRLKYGANNSNHELMTCGWMHKEEDKPWYSRIFQRGFDSLERNKLSPVTENDYSFIECPDVDPDSEIMLDLSNRPPEAVSHVNWTEFDPFSMLDPNRWTPHGNRKESAGLSGGDERPEDMSFSFSFPKPEDDEGVPCSVDPINPNCLETGELRFEMTTLRDMQNINEVPGDRYELVADYGCLEVSSYEDNMVGCGNGEKGGRFLELVLELKPGFQPPNPPDPGAEPTPEQVQDFPKYLSLMDNSTLSWKQEFLYLVSDIFSHLCMPFKPEMPYRVARIFGWYVYKGHLFGNKMTSSNTSRNENWNPDADSVAEKTDPWPLLIKELQMCSGVAKRENGGQGLKFQWEVGDDSGHWKIPPVSKPPEPTTKRKKRSSEEVKRRPVRMAYTPKKKPEVAHSRQKRDYKVNGSIISTRYLLPGKTLKSFRSEGTSGWVREVIQEYKPKPNLNDPRIDSEKYHEYPENIQHCWNPREDPLTRRAFCSKTEDIFFYEDRAEVYYELNLGIDLWWKIWGTVIGYCNKAYHARKSETFPRLYSLGYEYFFDLVQGEWKSPFDNGDLKIVLSEYLTEESQIWLDACMEASYLSSNSPTFRPPRPMTLNEKAGGGVNYFEEMPSYMHYRNHPVPSAML